MEKYDGLNTREFKAAINIAMRVGAINCSEEVSSSSSSSSLYGEYFLRDINSNLLIRIDNKSMQEELIFGINYETKIAYERRLKDTGWGYAFAHLIPFFGLYYAIDRRTISPIFYIATGTFIYFSFIYLLNTLFPSVDIFLKKILYSYFFLFLMPLEIYLAKLGIKEARDYAKYILKGNSVLKKVSNV